MPNGAVDGVTALHAAAGPVSYLVEGVEPQARRRARTRRPAARWTSACRW